MHSENLFYGHTQTALFLFIFKIHFGTNFETSPMDESNSFQIQPIKVLNVDLIYVFVIGTPRILFANLETI